MSIKLDLLMPSPSVNNLNSKVDISSSKETNKSFGDLLQNALDNVNTTQLQADQSAKQYLAGADIDLHQVMILNEKANMALQLTTQVRNKLLDAYQEISRMQI